MTLLATDRYRLAMRELHWNPTATDASHVVLIPARTLSDTARSLGASGSIDVALGTAAGGDGLVGFEAGQRRTTTRLLDGEYPKVSSIFPTTSETESVIRTADLVEAVKRVALVAERNTPVRLRFSEGQVTHRGRRRRRRPGVRGRRGRAHRARDRDRLQPHLPPRRPGSGRARRSAASPSPSPRGPPCSPARPRRTARPTRPTATSSCPSVSRPDQPFADAAAVAFADQHHVVDAPHTTRSTEMQLGLVGLGKMGGNMRERLRRAGHEVVGYDQQPGRLRRALPGRHGQEAAMRRGSCGSWSRTAPPPATPSLKLAGLLDKGDLVIDGGNSKFTDDLENEKLLKAKGIGYLDCGVSGGIWGLDNGYGLMVGGSAANVKRAMPIFDALRPEGPRDEGFVHAGKVRRRPLHEDGAQRHRVRPHARLRRGLRAAAEEGHRRERARGVQGVEPRHRRPLLAARPHGQGARGEPRPRRRLGLHDRLRRGPVDGRGGDQPRGADAGHLGLVVRPVRLPPAVLARRCRRSRRCVASSAGTRS